MDIMGVTRVSLERFDRMLDDYLDQLSNDIEMLRSENPPNRLPQGRLEALAAHGQIVAVQTFDEHMSPQIHWIEPEEFGAEFERLVSGA